MTVQDYVAVATAEAVPQDNLGKMESEGAQMIGLIDTSEDKSIIDPLNSGFLWVRPSRELATEHKSGAFSWTISGDDMQVLTTTVPPNETFITEVGSSMFMHPAMMTSVELTCCPPSPESMNRVLGGESCVKVFLSNPTRGETYVGVTPNFPAKVVPVKFGEHVKINSALVAKRGAIMSQMGTVDIGCTADFNPATFCCAGLGLCRQHIADGGNGNGIAFLAAGGTLVQKDLRVGETIVIDSGSVVAFEDSCSLGIRPSGRLCMCFFGGEGCFNTTLTGPGRVWLQSMSFEKFHARVAVTQNSDDTPKQRPPRNLVGQFA